MIEDDLERLANRGPHDSPSAVIDDAIAAATKSPERRPRHQLLVAAGVVALVAGLVVVLALVRGRGEDTSLVDSPPPVSTSPEVQVSTTLGAVGREISCSTVEFGWPDPPAGVTVTAETIRSSSVNPRMGYEISGTDPYVFMTRGASIDDLTPLLPEQESQVVPVEINGYRAQVRPPGAGTAGQNVSFVFPATATPDDPCNQWFINANTPMDTDDFVALVESIEMYIIEDISQVSSTTEQPAVTTPGGAPVLTMPLPELGDAPTFTPLLLETVPNGYWLDQATFITSPDGTTTGNVQYRGNVDDPAIQLWLSSSFGPVVDDDRPATPGQSWDVNGRRVTNSTSEGTGGEGCRSDYCAVTLIWDDQTGITISWQPIAGQSLLPDHNPDQLVELVAELYEADPDAYRAAATYDTTLLSSLAMVTAGADGVEVIDGRGFALGTNEPSHRAVVLPDGRTLIQTAELADPDHLFLRTPLYAGQFPPLEPFWPPGVPDDGSVRVDIQDAATVNGRPTLLYAEITGPCTGLDDCTGALKSVAMLGDPAPTIVFEFPDSAFKTSVKAQLSNVPYPGLVVGQYDGDDDIIPIIATPDGVPGTDTATLGLQHSYPASTEIEFATTDGHIAWILDNELIVRDLTGNIDDIRITLTDGSIRPEPGSWTVDGLQVVVSAPIEPGGSYAYITFTNDSAASPATRIAQVNLLTGGAGFHSPAPGTTVTLGNR